ncbi:MAG: retron system putative HNH endonuclease [Eubacteriales bacterium]|nr:retron system putative HNH endonuclease [Eubacteriales bacterium]
MIYICKGKEPNTLKRYRKQPYAYFDGCNKDDIRQSLLEEQGYLCAYCMRRIDKEQMKIEHWYPEYLLSEQQRLEYHNMLGVCIGHIEGQKGRDDTCDSHKQNTIITVNPCEPKMISEIQYKSKSGEIYSENPVIQKDINETLNLNSIAHRLPQNRKHKLNAVIQELSRKLPQGKWTKSRLENIIKLYSKPDSTGKKAEYIGIVLWYLNKKIG